jgi:hypothetical protein
MSSSKQCQYARSNIVLRLDGRIASKKAELKESPQCCQASLSAQISALQLRRTAMNEQLLAT